MVEGILIVIIALGSFATGMIISDHYHEQAAQEKDYALRKQYARLKAGVDADDTGPYVPPPAKRTLSQEFMTRLRQTGHAIERFGPARQAAPNTYEE